MTRLTTLDKKYIQWLKNIVVPDDIDNHRGNELFALFEYLGTKPFIWSVDRDTNRAFDGVKLREIYQSQGNHLTVKWRDMPCTVLEMLVGLSIRIETDIMGEPGDDHPERWFQIMLQNLGIWSDKYYIFDYNWVDQIMDNWLQRRFKSNGEGSIFPLKKAKNDQRMVEIWNQMNNFLNENYL